ncbi:MAG: hypothetical protein WBN04_09505, partial [Paracoccaceae bacterium]
MASTLSNFYVRGPKEGEPTFSHLELDEEYAEFFNASAEASVVADNPVLSSYGMSVFGSEIQLADRSTKPTVAAIYEMSAAQGQWAKAGSFVGGLLG